MLSAVNWLCFAYRSIEGDEFMALFSEKELGHLAGQIGRELAQRWSGMEQKLARSDIVTIANTGLVNSGKSSLFNALLAGRFDEERFPVGAVRTTKHGDREHLSDWVDIVDTPGIDAADEDDKVAFETLMASDLIVATHNIKIGMLNKSEYDWLVRLAKDMASEDIQRRLIFVCTWIDERDRDASSYQEVVNETKRQVFQALGTEVSFWELSAKRYTLARQKKSEAMEQASKIPGFKSFLLERAREVQKTMAAQRQADLEKLCKETCAALQQNRQDAQYSINEKSQKVRIQFEPAFRGWDTILKNFNSKRSNVQQKLSELESEQGSSISGIFANKIYQI